MAKKKTTAKGNGKGNGKSQDQSRVNAFPNIDPNCFQHPADRESIKKLVAFTFENLVMGHGRTILGSASKRVQELASGL